MARLREQNRPFVKLCCFPSATVPSSNIFQLTSRVSILKSNPFHRAVGEATTAARICRSSATKNPVNAFVLSINWPCCAELCDFLLGALNRGIVCVQTVRPTVLWMSQPFDSIQSRKDGWISAYLCDFWKSVKASCFSLDALLNSINADDPSSK